VSTVGAGKLAQRETAGLDDHVVERRGGPALLDNLLELRPHLDRSRHVDLHLEIEVRDGRLRLRHPPRNRLLETVERDDLGLALGGLGSRRTLAWRRCEWGCGP